MPISRLRKLRRIRKILSVFFDEGFGYLIRRAHLHRYVPFSKKLKERILKEEKIPEPVHLRKAFEKLGPTFIKFGQVLSLRPDILPPDYIKEFEKMQDDVPQFSYQSAKRIVEKELGKPINKIFSTFEKKPVASASISQVHKAKLKTGQIVAVKIQRPNTEKLFKEDIAILSMIAHQLEKRVSFFKTHRISDVIREFQEWTQNELDFRKEALNYMIMRENLSNKPNIVIPQIYDHYSTHKVLTMQFLEGKSLHDFSNEGHKKLHKIITDSYEAMIEMIYKHGFFHGDPHPGNILILKNGKLGLIDFGIVGTFNDSLRKESLRMFKGILEQDADQVMKALQNICDPNSENKSLKSPELKKRLKEIVDQIYYGKVKNIQIGLILEDVFQMAAEYRLNFPLDYVLFAKTIMTLEGIGLRYDPEFSITYEAKRAIAKIVKEEYSPKQLTKRLRKGFAHYQEILEKAPDHLMDALETIKKGKIDLKIDETEIRGLREELEHSSGNLSIGFVTGGLVVASALIMQTLKEPSYYGYPVIGIAGLSLAGLLTLWLIKRTIFAKI